MMAVMTGQILILLKNKNISVLKHKFNISYDAALTTGFKYAFKKI